MYKINLAYFVIAEIKEARLPFSQIEPEPLLSTNKHNKCNELKHIKYV